MRPVPPHIGLVALDLDGTVVAKDLSVTQNVIDVIARARKANIHTTIVTGRMYRATVPFIEKLGITGPVVCFQGAGIFEAGTGEVLRHSPVPNALAVQVIAYAQSRGLHIQLYAEGTYFVEQTTAFGALYAYVSGVEPELVESLAQRFAQADSTKIVIVTTPEQAGGIEAELRELCGSAAYVTRSNPEFVEILAPGVDKGDALAFVAARLGVPLRETLAVGDSWNDIPLLQRAGYGVAMGNAPAAAREASDAQVADVEHDGVVEAYERFAFPTALGARRH